MRRLPAGFAIPLSGGPSLAGRHYDRSPTGPYEKPRDQGRGPATAGEHSRLHPGAEVGPSVPVAKKGAEAG